MKWTTRDIQLVKKYDTPETVCLVTSFPQKNGESAERNAISNYSRELVRELGHKVPVVVVAEILGKPQVYEDNGVLVIRGYQRGSLAMNIQIYSILRTFTQAQQVLLQFEFGVYGGSPTTFLLSLLGFLVKLQSKKFSVMIHQVTHDLGELAEHLGISPRSPKTAFYNLGMRCFYRASGWGADRLMVHNSHLAKRLSLYVDERKIAVIPHGVSKINKGDRHVSRRKLGWKDDEFVILVFGYLSWYKGSDWIVRKVGPLLKSHAGEKIRLVLAGGESGTLRDMKHYRAYLEKLYRLAREYDAEITGYVHDEDKKLYFSACDLVILPHRVAMSESGVMAHVAAYGTPFLASEARAISLDDRKLRSLVTFNDKTFDTKLNSFMSNRRLRNTVALHALKMGQARNWSAVADLYLAALPLASSSGYTEAVYAKIAG